MVKLSLTLILALCCRAAHASDRDRAAFARAMSKLCVGMTEEQVRRHLGEPERIVTGWPTRRFGGHVAKAWGYGVVRKIDGTVFASYGYVCFDAQGTVIRKIGETPPARQLRVPERRLRQILAHIDSVGRTDGALYNPTGMIRAVNGLHTLSKNDVLEGVREYERVRSPLSSSSSRSVCLLLVCLLDSPPNKTTRLGLGVPSPRITDADRAFLPRYPILIVADIPLVLVHGYTFFGSPTRMVQHVAEWFQAAGPMRAKPLRPHDNPLEVWYMLRALPSWQHYLQLEDSDRLMVAGQLWSTVEHLVPDDRLHHRSEDGAGWRAAEEHLRKVGIHWEPEEQAFVQKKKETDE